MPEKTPAPAAAPADTLPIGTPPAGGRWAWDGGWVPLPEADEAAAPAAAPTTTPKE